MARNMVRKREIGFFVVCIGQSNVSKRYHGETHTHLQLWFSHHFFVFFPSFPCANAQEEHVKLLCLTVDCMQAVVDWSLRLHVNLAGGGGNSNTTTMEW